MTFLVREKVTSVAPCPGPSAMHKATGQSDAQWEHFHRVNPHRPPILRLTPVEFMDELGGLMSTMVVQERHLCLYNSEMRDTDKVNILLIFFS